MEKLSLITEQNMVNEIKFFAMPCNSTKKICKSSLCVCSNSRNDVP